MPVQPATHHPEIGKCDVQTYAVCVEPTAGYWTNNSKFGQRFSGSLPATEGALINLIDNPRLPGVPAPWTVNLFRSNKNLSNEASPLQNSDVRARITYGAGGASNTFDCDVLAGMQFELVCNAIKIDLVGYNPCPSNDVYIPGPGLIVGALVGKGTGSASLPVTYTDFFRSSDPLNEGPIVDLQIPDFARSLCFHVNEDDPANLAGCFIAFNTPGTTGKLVSIETLYDQLQSEKGIAIPAGVNQVRVDLSAAASPVLWAIQWFLAL